MTLMPEIDAFDCVAHGDCAVVAPQAFHVDDVAVVVGVAPDEVLLRSLAGVSGGSDGVVDEATGEEVDPG